MVFKCDECVFVGCRVYSVVDSQFCCDDFVFCMDFLCDAGLCLFVRLCDVLVQEVVIIYIYNHKANADRRKILSTRVLPNCIELLLVGIELQFAASKTPAHSTEPNGPLYVYIYKL